MPVVNKFPHWRVKLTKTETQIFVEKNICFDFQQNFLTSLKNFSQAKWQEFCSGYISTCAETFSPRSCLIEDTVTMHAQVLFTAWVEILENFMRNHDLSEYQALHDTCT